MLCLTGFMQHQNKQDFLFLGKVITGIHCPAILRGALNEYGKKYS